MFTVKAQIPLFFTETPFDRGLTKHLKQAYSAMDSVATRITAVLLRRYPIARIIVLIYMVWTIFIFLRSLKNNNY